MTTLQYLSMAISPALIIIGVLILYSRNSLDSFKNIGNSILLGVLAVLLVYAANYLVELRWHGNLRSMRRMAFLVFIGIAFSAELGKFIPLRLFNYRLPSFKGSMEAIVFSIAIGLGYSTLAVPLFAYGLIGTSINSITIFLFVYPFANIVFAIVMGFFVGLGKNRTNGLIDNSTGLFLATFFHGVLYFTFITKDIRLFILTVIGFAIISITLLVRAKSMFNKREEK